MKKYIIYISLCFLMVLGACEDYELQGQQLPAPIESADDTQSLIELLEQTQWETQTVADGMVWKKHQFDNIFDSRQYITMFDVDLNQSGIKIDIPHVTSGFLKTSEAAEKAGATLAFNGSYFDTSIGGSTVFFKHAGKIITQTKQGFTSYRENSALAISTNGRVTIEKRPGTGWEALDANYVLAGGPLLVYNGEVIEQMDQAFNTNRHPRTAVGVTKENHLIVLVIDGRSSQSQGLTTPQLGELMKALGCAAAMNMDGGGSSTAWVKDQGVVNHPSDNKLFDHAGERGVATVFTIK